VSLKMKRRDLQFGLIKALGGGFDSTGINLAVNGPGPQKDPQQSRLQQVMHDGLQTLWEHDPRAAASAPKAAD
jgi:hypothetical protein